MAETKALLDEFDGQKLQNRIRRGLRAGGKVMREGIRDEARRRRDLPRSFAKTKTRTSASARRQGDLAVIVRPTSPLVNIFEGGAGGHEIGSGGKLLVNRDAGFVARGPVHHPGMAARPLIAPVFAANEGKAKDAVGHALFEGLR